MKIGIIGPSYPYRGGIAAFNVRLAQEYVSQGHEVTLYTFTLQYPGFLFPGTTQYSDDPAPEGLNIVRCINSCNPFNWIRAGRCIRRDAPDMVVFAYWMSYFAPCFGTISRILGRKVRKIGLIHNMISHEANLMDKLLPSYFVKTLDGMVALCDKVLKDIRLYDDSKPVTVCPHPLYDHFGKKESREEAAAALGLDPSGEYALFFGLIRDYKGLDWLLEAFTDEKLKDKKLIVAGEFYGDGRKYYDLVESLGIADRVVWFAEFIPDDAVRHFFSLADLVALPYRSATQSGVTQIAYHFELPMLVTDVGALRDVVPDREAGYCVHPDPESICSALVEFFTEKPDFSDGIKAGKSRYSWSRMAEALVHCHEN
ncbi:MAG: glycosyltransferase [Bacteroidales bacterium]|nr:glycosyltransferase [Bacteroidales bacterium]